MIYLLLIWIVAFVIGLVLELLFGTDMIAGMLWGFGMEVIIFIVVLYIFNRTHWGKVRLRAWNMADLHKKRIAKENLETWNRNNREFIKKCEKEDSREQKNDDEDDDTTSIVSSVGGFMNGTGL